MIDFAVSLRQEKVNVRQICALFIGNLDSREIDAKNNSCEMGKSPYKNQNNEKTQ